MNFILAFADAVPAAEGADWTPSAVTNLIATLGFPIVAAYMLWVFVRARIETSEKAAADRERLAMETADKREGDAHKREEKLVERINHLEDTVRTELVAVVNKATDVMEETKECMSQCAGTLAVCTQTLGDMRDEAKRQKVGIHG